MEISVHRLCEKYDKRNFCLLLGKSEYKICTTTHREQNNEQVQLHCCHYLATYCKKAPFSSFILLFKSKVHILLQGICEKLYASEENFSLAFILNFCCMESMVYDHIPVVHHITKTFSPVQQGRQEVECCSRFMQQPFTCGNVHSSHVLKVNKKISFLISQCMVRKGV